MALDKEASAMHLIEKLAEYRVGAIALTKIEKLAARIGIDGTKLLELYVKEKNAVSKSTFAKTSFDKRLLFLPQCLRSTECPAKLTPDGIVCVNCGRCEIGKAKEYAEGLGYSFFIVPGSSFIKRIIGKHLPRGIIGVGCQLEVKEGLDLCNSYGIPAIGIPLSTSGCVSTTLDWNLFYRTISAGTDRGYQVNCKKPH